MNKPIDNEIPKYLKQKESNVSKAKKKSKHKHQYEECLIQYYFNKTNLNKKIHTSLCSYCTICGKIGDRFKDGIVTNYLQTEYINGKKYFSVMTGEELYERYHDRLPVFFVEDYWKDDYVNLEQQDDK